MIALALFPPVYLLLAIQYSAITVPFWDHTEIIRWIAAWHEGTFSFLSLAEPHNHTRPFVYRLVMVLNAVATDWDLRSEYIYLYLAIYGTFACFLWLACRIVVGAEAASIRPLSILTISLLAFSPVGHNNHWWSMMFQLDATNFFIALSMTLVFARPTSWISHIVAALSCWLAAFTLTNGFFAMAALLVVSQLSAPALLRVDRFALFWGANLLVAAIAYLPGMHMDSSPVHPTIFQVIEFALAYLGAPLGGLLWFPFRSTFEIPQAMAVNVICGCGVLASGLILAFDALPRLRQRHSAAMVLYGFAGFAVLSALATGWARAAFDVLGVANGNASRYTIFGAYLLLGQVYYIGAGLAQNWWLQSSNPLMSRRIVVALTTVFVVASLVSYGRGWRVYSGAHDFSRHLAQAYAWGLQPTDRDQFIHPRPEAVTYLKSKLQLFELGPYANRSYEKVPFPIGTYREAVLLSAGHTVTQRFTPTADGLKRLSFRVVTPNGKAATGAIKWTLREVGSPEPIHTGAVAAKMARDWAQIDLKLPYVANSKGRLYELVFTGEGEDRYAVGVPLYDLDANGTPAAAVSDGRNVGQERGAMFLSLEYVK